jgi:tRNA-dihydrouridine synthase B
MLADAARYNADAGAQIIDINMGCPAKKVCNVYAGSALLQDEALVAVHGRTREQGFLGQAEYDTIAAVKAALRIPVVANGDIDSPAKAREVLRRTGADALMIGRAAQGRPWIFREIAHELATGAPLSAPATADVRAWLLEHLNDHYALHGEYSGVRSARKHIGWAVRALPGGEAFRAVMNTLDSCAAQVEAVATFFERLGEVHRLLPPASAANDDALSLAA